MDYKSVLEGHVRDLQKVQDVLISDAVNGRSEPIEGICGVSKTILDIICKIEELGL